MASGDVTKGPYLPVIVRKIPCAPAPCLQLLENTFRCDNDASCVTCNNDA